MYPVLYSLTFCSIKGSLQKKIKSVDFFHTGEGGGGPGQIHTFIKVWKIGCFLVLFPHFMGGRCGKYPHQWIPLTKLLQNFFHNIQCSSIGCTQYYVCSNSYACKSPTHGFSVCQFVSYKGFTPLLIRKRGIAKSSFVCEGAPKIAPSGQNEPKFCMQGSFGVQFPEIYNWRPSGL